MRKQIMHLVKGEEGVTALEYGLIAALIAAVIVGAVTILGTKVNSTFTSIANSMPDAGGS
ncbi:MAG: Flp family type IVb pilin [Thermodesulfobacteriota bacterium]|nr:Flp family type IVb pilin [Thermodesulfobacteriota bacterium]